MNSIVPVGIGCDINLNVRMIVVDVMVVIRSVVRVARSRVLMCMNFITRETGSDVCKKQNRQKDWPQRDAG